MRTANNEPNLDSMVRRGGLEPRVLTENNQVIENAMSEKREIRQKSVSWHVYGTRDHSAEACLCQRTIDLSRLAPAGRKREPLPVGGSLFREQGESCKGER
jgi:hypothetical protein